MVKYGTGRQATGDNIIQCMRFACWITDATNTHLGNRGSTVVKVLCYKSEGRWFDSNWCHWNFSLT